MKTKSISWCIAAMAVLLVAPAHGQSLDVLRMEISVDEDFVVVPANGINTFTLTVTDRSLDGTGHVEDAPPFSPQSHTLSFSLEPEEIKRGWLIQAPSAGSIKSGETQTFKFRLLADATAEDPYYPVRINVTMSGRGESTWAAVVITGYSPGLETYGVTVPGSFMVAPLESSTVPVRVSNVGVFPRTFDFEITDNPCNADVQAPTSLTVLGKSSAEAFVTVRGPAERFWYQSESCAIGFSVAPQDNADQERSFSVQGQVSGFYWDPVWSMWVLAAAGLILLLVLFVRRRKEIIEEEILGKPQKPWTIPVERVYLEHLEAKDPRAAYVVRHFLMEEEYASSLLWYKHYKQATKGQRSKESLVVRQERKYDRFQNKWQKRIAAPIKEADRFKAKLQKKLDRQAKAAVRKERRNWKKLVSKIEKAHAAQELKANAKWEKAAAKAEKKGQPVPPKPQFAPPDLPEAPTLQKIHLEDHKWNKKAVKFRKKMVKRQGDIEVKFEKKDARMLHKLRRKVQKIARKLDDPDFVDEHPLLAKGA